MDQKLVCGVGINDVPGHSKRLVSDPFYVTWQGMLKRCYCAKYLSRFPTYTGCSVTERWLTFSSFKEWMLAQSWEGKVLDKDLLVTGNKHYSPETCLFIPEWLNAFLSSLAPQDRDLPTGVSNRNNRFRARYNRRSNPVHLGYFDTPQKAHLAYRKYRLAEILERFAMYCERPDAELVAITALHRLYESEISAIENLSAAA